MSEADYPQLQDGFGNQIRLDETGVNVNTGGNPPGSLPFLVNGAAVSGAVLKSASVLVTSAQLLALTSAPVVLVPGVSGHYLSLQGAILEYIFGTTPYTIPASNEFDIQVGPSAVDGSDANIVGNIPATGFIDQSNDVIFDATNITITGGLPLGGGGNIPAPSSEASGQAIYLVEQGGTDVTVGDGTLKITVYYFDFEL
jgi:hypothetical protein